MKSEMKFVKFHELDGEQKLNAIRIISYEEEEPETETQENIEHGWDVDDVYIFKWDGENKLEVEKK